MNKTNVVGLLFPTLALTLLAGCGSSGQPTPAPLSAGNLNLIFVVSEDLAYQASGDVNPKTANLTNQGLQRSLLMATFLQQNVLGALNVTGIYALEPMTHLQTAGNYPDMIGLETIQQFAMLNQITLSSDQYGGTPLAGQSYPRGTTCRYETLLASSMLCIHSAGLSSYHGWHVWKHSVPPRKGKGPQGVLHRSRRQAGA